MSFYDEVERYIKDNDDLLGRMNNLLTVLEKHSFVLRTKLRRNKYSEIFCQECDGIINLSTFEAATLTHCPHCERIITECKFDN